MDNAILSEFEALAGLEVIDSYEYAESGKALLNGNEIEFSRTRNIITKATTAEVLAYDNKGIPFISVNKYGNGRVFFVNAPLEINLTGKHNAFDKNTHLVYRELFEKHINSYPVSVNDKELMLTYHPTDDGAIVVVLNHYGDTKEFSVNTNGNFKTDKVYYGSTEKIGAYDACVFKIVKTASL